GLSRAQQLEALAQARAGAQRGGQRKERIRQLVNELSRASSRHVIEHDARCENRDTDCSGGTWRSKQAPTRARATDGDQGGSKVQAARVRHDEMVPEIRTKPMHETVLVGGQCSTHRAGSEYDRNHDECHDECSPVEWRHALIPVADTLSWKIARSTSTQACSRAS